MRFHHREAILGLVKIIKGISIVYNETFLVALIKESIKSGRRGVWK